MQPENVGDDVSSVAVQAVGLVLDDDDCHEVSLDGPLPEGVLGEVRAHREIYRLRPDVNGIVRCMPPKVMSLGAMRRVPRPRHGFGSYFYPSPVLWDDPQLLRDDEQGRQFAAALGAQRAILMRVTAPLSSARMSGSAMSPRYQLIQGIDDLLAFFRQRMHDLSQLVRGDGNDLQRV